MPCRLVCVILCYGVSGFGGWEGGGGGGFICDFCHRYLMMYLSVLSILSILCSNFSLFLFTQALVWNSPGDAKATSPVGVMDSFMYNVVPAETFLKPSGAVSFFDRLILPGAGAPSRLQF